jgi:hypothetical protein
VFLSVSAFDSRGLELARLARCQAARLVPELALLRPIDSESDVSQLLNCASPHPLLMPFMTFAETLLLDGKGLAILSPLEEGSIW